MLGTEPDVEAFTAFARQVEPRLRRALVAAYGGELGREATAEALAYGWEHWRRLRQLRNPAGYLYRVGQSQVRRLHRLRKGGQPRADPEKAEWAPWTEPGLPAALSRLTERQRQAVVLVYAFEWTFREVSELTGVAIPTVQKHVKRGLDRLRAELNAGSMEVDDA